MQKEKLNRYIQIHNREKERKREKLQRKEQKNRWREMEKILNYETSLRSPEIAWQAKRAIF